MRRRAFGGIIAAAALALAVPVALAIASGQQGGAAARFSRTLDVSCRSPALGGRLPTAVYLPAGYWHGSSRFPVVYFLHGLPAGPRSYKENAFVAEALAASGHEAIVVAPQGARGANSDREYLDWGPEENWPGAIAVDLPRCIDARFRTVANRWGRALIGLSAGGFGAFNVGLRRLGTFAAVESWSGYFTATDPSGTTKLELGSAGANRRARVPRGPDLKQRLARLPTFIGFYVGRRDARFLAENVRLDRAFTAHGISHSFAVYEGGHSLALWQEEAQLWLGLALQHLLAS